MWDLIYQGWSVNTVFFTIPSSSVLDRCRNKMSYVFLVSKCVVSLGFLLSLPRWSLFHKYFKNIFHWCLGIRKLHYYSLSHRLCPIDTTNNIGISSKSHIYLVFCVTRLWLIRQDILYINKYIQIWIIIN